MYLNSKIIIFITLQFCLCGFDFVNAQAKQLDLAGIANGWFTDVIDLRHFDKTSSTPRRLPYISDITLVFMPMAKMQLLKQNNYAKLSEINDNGPIFGEYIFIGLNTRMNNDADCKEIVRKIQIILRHFLPKPIRLPTLKWLGMNQFSATLSNDNTFIHSQHEFLPQALEQLGLENQMKVNSFKNTPWKSDPILPRIFLRGVPPINYFSVIGFVLMPMTIYNEEEKDGFSRFKALFNHLPTENYFFIGFGEKISGDEMNSVVQAVVRKANQNPTNPTRPTIQLLALGWCKFTFDKVNKVEYEKLENRFVRAPLLMLEKTNMMRLIAVQDEWFSDPMEMNQFKNSPISESLTMRQSVRVILFPMEYLDKLIETIPQLKPFFGDFPGYVYFLMGFDRTVTKQAIKSAVRDLRNKLQTISDSQTSQKAKIEGNKAANDLITMKANQRAVYSTGLSHFDHMEIEAHGNDQMQRILNTAPAIYLQLLGVGDLERLFHPKEGTLLFEAPAFTQFVNLWGLGIVDRHEG